jgi:hypothetical protein
MRKNIIFMFAVGLVSGSLAHAQDAMQGKVGINMRVDPAPRIGITYHIANHFALRPYVGFSVSSTEAENEFVPRNQQGLPDPRVFSGDRREDSTRFTAGLGLLYTFYTGRSLSVYTGANFAYARDTVEVEVSWRDRGWKDRGELFGVNALLGLQGRLLENLGIFGEVGFGYSGGSYEHDDQLEATRRTDRWGLTNSGIGLVFYF